MNEYEINSLAALDVTNVQKVLRNRACQDLSALGHTPDAQDTETYSYINIPKLSQIPHAQSKKHKKR